MFGTSVPYLYDAIYRYKDYNAQAQSILNNLTNLSAPEATILEMACGTGRFLESFKSYAQFGIDLCEESLMYASFRNPSAKFKSFNINVINQDTSPFEQKQFDVVLSLFGAIGYTPPEELETCLQNWLSLLPEKGILVLEPWHFSPETGQYTQKFQSSNLEINRLADVSVSDGWTTMNFGFTVKHPNGRVEELQSTERLYSHSVAELKRVIEALGASVLHKEASDFQEDGQWYIGRS